MKNLSKLVFAAFIAAAPCLPAFAQEDEASMDEVPAETQAQAPKAPPAAPAAKKPAVKKKKAKKKKAAPVSEYKFQSDNPTPTYKFDKKADPILKKAKAKKKAKTAAAVGTDGKPVPKLKKVKSIGEEDTPESLGLPAIPKGAGKE